MSKVTLPNGLNVHYQQVGEGPDVVLIHGLTGDLAVWHLHIVGAIADRCRTLTYDLRGHGRSATPPTGYTLDDMAEDLLELLDTLELEKPLVVGHSYGADVGLYLAANHPGRVAEVIAIEAALPAMEALRATDEWVGWHYWIKALESAGIEVPADKRTDLRYLVDATIDLPKQWGPLRGLPRDARLLHRLMNETSLPADYRKIGSLTVDRLPEITDPVVLMYTEHSAFIDTYDQLLPVLPNVEPVLLPRSEYGHFGPLEQPGLVAEHIVARVERLSAAGTAD